MEADQEILYEYGQLDELREPHYRVYIYIYIYTAIPRLTKIIRSGITFVSQNLR